MRVYRDDEPVPTDHEMALAFDKVRDANPGHDIEFMEGPFAKYSTSCETYSYMSGWGVDRSKYPDNIRQVMIDGIGLIVIPQQG